MKKLNALILSLLLPFMLSAQENVDSLLNVLQTQKRTSEEKIQLYWEIMITYWNNDLEKTILYAGEGLNFSKKEQNHLWSARFSRILGFSYIHKNEYDLSLRYLENAVEFAVKAKDKKEENIATTYLGTLYIQQGKYELGLKYFMKALPSLENLQQNEHYANALINIAIIYQNLRNTEKACEYGRQAFAIAEKHDLPYPKMCSLEILGDSYYQKNQLDSALVCMLQAYEMSRQLNDKPRTITSAQMLANAYCVLKEYDKAEKYAEECLEIAEEFEHIVNKFMAWSVLSYIRFGQQRYKESEMYAYKIWETDSTRLEWAMNASLALSKANISLYNPSKAIYFLDKYEDIRDQLSTKELHSSLADMEVKYETEKKEMRIAALEEEKKLYAGLGAAIVAALLLGIGLIIYRYRSKRKIAEQQIKQLKQENELIATRATLDAEKTEREIIARDLHDGVGAMLSVVKNNMNMMKSYSIIENTEVDYFNRALDGLDKSITELRRVAHHIMPAILIEQGLAVALDDFCRSIPEAVFHFSGTGRRFDSEKEIALYRCAYELVNNALRHSGASGIDVHLNRDETTAYLSIVDNGCGFDLQTASMGMGIRNLRTRLSAFGGRMDIFSEPGNGTEVNVEMEV